MLGSLGNPTLPGGPYGSPGENVMGAGNQQERLVNLGWVLGFVDGEGCFCIGFVRQSSQTKRDGYLRRFRLQVTHEFAVTQGAKSIQCLQELREFLRDRSGTHQHTVR